MIRKDQYWFENISTTKAQIFMKFYVVINYYLVSLSFKFHEYPCRNVRARVVKPTIAINGVCAHLPLVHLIYAWIVVKFETLAHKIVIDYHIKFHEDPSFCCGDICKTILGSEYYYQNPNLTSTHRFGLTWKWLCKPHPPTTPQKLFRHF